MILVIFLASLTILASLYWIMMEKRTPIPKGLKELPIERGLPFVGIMFQIKSSMTSYVKQLGRKHGPLFAFRLGMRDIVVLNNYDMINKALKSSSDVFSGRFKPEFRKQLTRDTGVIFVDGETWTKHRAFVITAFRDFEMGKSLSEDIALIECSSLLGDLTKSEGKPVNIYDLFSFYIAKVISNFVIGQRGTRENKKITIIDQLIRETIQSQAKLDKLCLMFPFLNTNFLFIKLSVALSSSNRQFKKVFEIFQHEINEHSKALEPHCEVEDIIDKFIIKQREMMKKFGTLKGVTDDNMIMLAYDLIGAGYETLTTLIEWSCLFMSKFPDIQQNVYLELMEKVGPDRMINTDDRIYLDYTQSVLDEVLRMSSIVPFSVPHRTLADTSIDGYFIRKDSIVFPNLYSCHYDPNTWHNPEQFDPERFLSLDSDGHRKYTPRKELIPFSIGKRNCPGKRLAIMEYFIFLMNVLQKFEISFAEEVSEQKYQDCLRTDGNISRASLIKSYVFKRRT